MSVLRHHPGPRRYRSCRRVPRFRRPARNRPLRRALPPELHCEYSMSISLVDLPKHYYQPLPRSHRDLASHSAAQAVRSPASAGRVQRRRPREQVSSTRPRQFSSPSRKSIARLVLPSRLAVEEARWRPEARPPWRRSFSRRSCTSRRCRSIHRETRPEPLSISHSSTTSGSACSIGARILASSFAAPDRPSSLILFVDHPRCETLCATCGKC